MINRKINSEIFTKCFFNDIIKTIEKGEFMKNFDELMKAVTKNVDYWAWYVSSKTSLEKEDVYQELLLIIWGEHCSRIKKGKPTTKYFMQKRLYYASIRIMEKFYHSIESVTCSLENEELNNIIDHRAENDKIKEWFGSISESLNKEADKRVKIIFSMLRQGFRNFEIAESMGVKQNTLSLIITRKIKKPLKEKMEENPFLDRVTHSEFVEVYS